VNGDRIGTLLVEIRETAEPATLRRVEELVERLLELYGSALARILAHTSERGAMSESLEAALVEDPLITALLVLHGLHPRGVTARIEAALDRVRHLLRSHAGGVVLVGIDDRGVVRVRLEGSCDRCASSQVTLRQLVQRAIEEAAPEIAGVEVEDARPATHPAPLSQLRRSGP
jgi:Fe-S cluster biogenesis protein NfuA